MPFKPSDFFLTVTSFLGILVPGAVLIFMLHDRLLPVFCDQPWATRWVVITVAAYVAGQILAALTESLNLVATPRMTIFRALGKDVCRFEQKLPVTLPDGVDRGTKFHAALSLLRGSNPAAAAEIDHLMADYKLLRSLVGVFVIDWLFSFSLPGHTWSSPRSILDGVLAVLTFLTFVRLYNWALLLAFQCCYLSPPERSTSSAAAARGSAPAPAAPPPPGG